MSLLENAKLEGPLFADQIDEMPAGPELDALACAAVGWEPKHLPRFFCGQCGSEAGKSGPTCGRWVEKQVVVVKPISTNIATAMEALGLFPEWSLCKIDKTNSPRNGTFWLACALPNPSGIRTQYCGESTDGPALAIARALAKMGSTR